jgi:hypothetical protein
MGWKVYVPPLKSCSDPLVNSRNTTSTAAGTPYPIPSPMLNRMGLDKDLAIGQVFLNYSS